MRDIDKKIAKAEKAVSRAEVSLQERMKALSALKESSIVECYSCDAELTVKDLIYIQYYNYVKPYGCTEGDYWQEHEGSFYCPECGEENRLYNRKEVADLRKYFKSIDDFYAEWDPFRGKIRAF